MSQPPPREDLHSRSVIFNPLSYAGLLIALISVIMIVALFILELNAPHPSPYLGILTYMVLPAFMGLGLLLVPIGMGLENRRRRRRAIAEEAPPPFPRIDLNQPRHQRLFAAWVVATMFILTVLSVVAYQSYEFMESTTFCGDVCHVVMRPEKMAYLDSPHARVACTSCHIGPGASWYVRSKLSGVGQVIAVLTDTYPRPIETPIEDLRPARETCEQCHWPEKFYGDKIVTHTRFDPDEQNTMRQLSLIVKTGGGSERTGVSYGIHWHMDPRNEVEYIATDDRRQEIAWVRSLEPDGSVTEYFSTEHAISREQIEQAEKRTMDCLDCHNRPTHIFFQPEEAVNSAMAHGRIDPSLPFARKVGVELITRQYASHEEAARAIRAEWDKYYRENYPQVYAEKGEAIRRAADELVAAYQRNVFPEMKVDWGTYIDHLGHQTSPGCFRCHDGRHVSADGRAIQSDCTICHSIPVQGEPIGLQVRPISAPTESAPASPQPPAPQQEPVAGGLHAVTTHAAVPCQTCHEGTPGAGPQVAGERCLTCHSDRRDHNPGSVCQTCHIFRD